MGKVIIGGLYTNGSIIIKYFILQCVMSFELFVIDKKEFERFLSKINKTSRVRLVRDMSFLKEHGSTLRMPFSKKIHSQLYELRTSGKQRVRIIYAIKGSQIYLVHWFVKKTQKMPQKELKTALKRLTTI